MGITKVNSERCAAHLGSMHVGSTDVPNRDAPFLHRLEDVEFQPVFIQGEHRSGTTLLYKLLAQSGCFNIVTVYHLLHYDELLANHLSVTEAEARRSLDERFKSLG